jgi:hypothetical protein
MTSDERKEELKRLCKRFEIAAANFVNSCISMKANECAFQAWFAASMIQEFGLARVYREVHLWKDDLFGLTDRQPITSAFDQGNELFPDVSISWQPDVDARHSSTRSEGCRHAGDMLAQLAIVSEFKVTGSTSKATPRSFIRQDLAKLGVYESAARSRDDTNVLAAYMVILDNYCSAEGEARAHYHDERISDVLADIRAEWPTGWKMPTLIIGSPPAGAASVAVYRDFVRQTNPSASSLPTP